MPKPTTRHPPLCPRRYCIHYNHCIVCGVMGFAKLLRLFISLLFPLYNISFLSRVMSYDQVASGAVEEWMIPFLRGLWCVWSSFHPKKMRALGGCGFTTREGGWLADMRPSLVGSAAHVFM